MRHEDRSRLLLYFAECVPGGLEADDASFLLRLPIFPGVTHSPQNPAWRPLTGGAAGGGAAGDAHMAQDAAVCPAEVLDAVCSGWAGLPANLQVPSWFSWFVAPLRSHNSVSNTRRRSFPLGPAYRVSL